VGILNMREWVEDRRATLAERPTQPIDEARHAGEATDQLGAEPPTLDDAQGDDPNPSQSDAVFDAALGRQSFEHRRIVSVARQKLFGRGQPLRIGRYAIERRIGAGGMGEVYLASDADLGRKVAVKRVLTRFSSPSHQERLRREARALARLSHPNVVQVYEFGEHEGRTFVAMEYVDGQTLAQWLAEGERSWQAVLDKFLAAGRGLAAVHQAGLVHRDFKPENVLLSGDGRVLVADFGVVLAGEDRRGGDSGEALRLGADMRTSVTGAILGTIRFMSLEQLCASNVDARSDQFSYCIALYEALWGKPPFTLSSSLARLDDLEAGEPMVPSSRGGLRPPARLWRVIRRGLAKDPDARWADMNALLGALEGETRRRRRLAWIGSAVAAASLVTAAVLISKDQPVDPCAAVERELEGVWDSERRAELERELVGLDVGHAVDSSQRVFAGLDRWSSGWVHERERVCRASDEQRIEPELARLQSACLTRQRQRVEDLVELLQQPGTDGDALASAVEAVAELPPASGCEDELALLGVEPPADGIEEQVEGLRRDVGRARELRLLGRMDEGLTLAEVTERAARELGYGPLLAEALGELAKAELAAGSSTRGLERMQEAIDAAELHRHDSLVADLWLELAMRSFTEFDEAQIGAWQLRRAEVANGRIGASTRSSARLEFARGQLAELRGDDTEAERGYRAAIGEAEFDEAARLDLPSYLSNLARIVAKRDRGEANVLFRSALEIVEAQYGPHHPQTARQLYDLALALRDADPGNDEIVELLERTVEIWTRSHERPHRDLAKAELLLGMLALRGQELDEAEVHARKSASIQTLTLPEKHLERGGTAHLLAVIHSVRGEHEQALEQLEATLAIWEPAYGLDDPRVQRVRSDVAATQLALGEIDDAAEGLALLLPHVQGQPEQVSVRLQLCEVAVRRGQLEAADTELEAIDTLEPDGLGPHEFSYVLLRALVDLRRGDLQTAMVERVHGARTVTPFTAAQIDTWLDQLELSPPERAALQIE
jgi:tetratricopeptide (TPR) repeat protein/predicted Ser/Thr protein kinase